MSSLGQGRVPDGAFDRFGVLITQGDPVIYAVNQYMVLPNNEPRVLIADPQNPLALLALMFDPPVTSFGFQRIGVQMNATLPKWRIEIIDGGRSIEQVGEPDFHADSNPRWFNFSGRSIEQVFIYSDNTYQGQTWSTYNFPPIVALTISRQ